MKKVLNFLFLSIVFVVSFVVVFPKEKLYFLANEKLKAYDVSLESSKLESSSTGLMVENTYVLLAGARVASIRNMDLSLFGIEIQRVRLLGNFASMFPRVDLVDVSYDFDEFAKASGNFGDIVASIDRASNSLILKAKVEKKTIKKYNLVFLNFKNVGGEYVYKLHF